MGKQVTLMVVSTKRSMNGERPLLQTSEDAPTSTAAFRLFVVEFTAEVLMATWYQ